MAAVYPPPGMRKSVQRGFSNYNVTVAAVNMSKASLTVTGVASDSSNAQNASLRITSSTQLTYEKGALTGTPTLAWELTEYY